MQYRMLAITQDANDPATRYRLGQYVPRLRTGGVEVDAVFWPRGKRGRSEILERAGDFDAVVVFRRLLCWRDIRRLRRAAKRLAFDFDDCITRWDSSWGPAWPLLDKVIEFRSMIGRCDAVTAGNAYLAETAARFARGGMVRVVPTTIDMTRYPSARTLPRGDPTHSALGWVGQRATTKYLRGIRKSLSTVCDARPGLVVRCITDAPLELPGVRTEFRRWSSATEVGDIRDLDVGLAPLPDDAWSRGKCGLRLLQYLAAGVPSVASSVGVQSEIGRKGGALLVRRAEEWPAAISRILDDPSLAEQLSGDGRAIVARDFAVDRWVPEVLESWCGIRPCEANQRRSA